MKRATTVHVCAAKCFIANINEFYGRLCGVYAHCVTGNVLQNNSKGHWEVKIISLAAEGT